MACILAWDLCGKWLRVVALFGMAWVGLGQDQVLQAQAVSAEPAAAAPARTLEDALHEMADAGGVIFAGQVMSVRRVEGEGASNPSSGAVEVVFQVDQAVRGCVAGGLYVLREWAGLWADGEPRYQAGQRLLMILRTPGAGGLSSPVGGTDGAIPIRGMASEIAGSGGGPGAGTPERMVDLRWVGARMLHAAGASVASDTGTPVTTGAPGTKGSSGIGESTSSLSTQGASVETVMAMLAAWGVTYVAR
jgi:hypothetical protein